MSATSAPPPANAVLLPNTDWETYTRLLHVFAERPAVRLTYDRGELEIRGPLEEIDEAEFLGCLAVTLTTEYGLPVKSGGSTTLRSRRKQRGLDPNRCYWIASEPQMRSKRRLNLRTDPPPDLALEVDTTHSLLNRMSIYAALGVPEVWRLEGDELTFQLLGSTRRYTTIPASWAFPGITPAVLLRFHRLRLTLGENATIHQFRLWVRSLRAEDDSMSTP